MDVNVEEGRSSLSLPPDRTVPYRWEPRQIESSSGSSELSKQSSKEFGLGVTESTSREWTDEKHNLYLKSMEASFVKQLHNNEYPSIDMLGWHSEDSLRNPNSSLLANANNGTHSRQFKVLQGGCWKKINYDRAQTKLDIGDRVLQDNQWIRRFRSAGKCQEVPFPNVLENDALSTEPIHPGEQDPETCGLMKSQKPTTSGRATSSKKLLPFYSCHQDYFASTTEASDQNFVDDDHEQTQISNPTRKKKMKKAINDVVVKDEDSGS